MIDAMVHYMTKPQLVTTQPTLRICPTCGNHACDEHATGRVTPTDTAVPDDLRMELAAMHAVGSAIGELRDQDARLRILRWAMERFHPDFAKAPKLTPMPQAAGETDSDLSVENLGLFENDAPVVNIARRSGQSEPELGSLVQD